MQIILDWRYKHESWHMVGIQINEIAITKEWNVDIEDE